MSALAELLTTPEAAVVAGVEVRDVNRLIDEHILPEGLYSNVDGRRIWAGTCALIRFYYDAASSLTAQERKFAIDTLVHEADAERAVRYIDGWHRERPRWRVAHSFITLDFDRFIGEALSGHEKLSRARAAVTEDPDILGGTPVIKGTRVPVHDVAASVAREIPRSRIRQAYPSLTDELIDLAVIYAKATPLRGRPHETRALAPAGSSRKVPRRRRA